jgi:hypothetical protein
MHGGGFTRPASADHAYHHQLISHSLRGLVGIIAHIQDGRMSTGCRRPPVSRRSVTQRVSWVPALRWSSCEPPFPLGHDTVHRPDLGGQRHWERARRSRHPCAQPAT